MGSSISYHKTPTEVSLGNKGRIRGVQFDNKSCRYAGVPYALPPVGENRWRKPQPLPSTYVYSGPNGEAFNAEQFKPVCPQKSFHVAEAEGGFEAFSEDCLHINIWTPIHGGSQGKKKWPVMLWLHGGWFQMGTPSQEPDMDPTEMISTGGLNAIVVAIGYRLNVFGFLAVQESATESRGNFGLLDQEMALKWVQENIGFFGGDSNNITLAGRSAGAYAVEAHMLHYLRTCKTGSLPFRRVFMDSNAIPAQPKSLADAQLQFNELCNHFQLPQHLSTQEKLAALRNLSWQDLLQAIPKLKNHTFRPVTDDLYIHSGMMEYLDSPEFPADFKRAGMRILTCEVLNEETLYSTYNSPTEPTIDSLRLQVSNYYAPDVTSRVLQSYSMPQSNVLTDWQQTFGRIIADGQVRAPSRALVQNLIRNGVPIGDVWRCQVAYRLSFINAQVAPMSFGVAHAMDKPFWNFSITLGPTPEEKRLMREWIEILVAFVNDDEQFEFGTTKIEQMKTVTPKGTIEIQPDKRWNDLIAVGRVFAGH
ncbi:hypothetical protein NX059_002833 [Plenodomus lindquistii]|nr:hypothetical protein NX059_002833 [Plenodomus lindquistii]